MRNMICKKVAKVATPTLLWVSICIITPMLTVSAMADEAQCVRDTKLTNVCREAFAGDGDAMSYIAVEYAHQKNVQQQYYWALRGVEVGNDRARTILAQMLLRGEGVKKNEGEAVRLLKLASEQSTLTEPRMILAFHYLQKENPTHLELDTAERLLKECIEYADSGDAAFLLGSLYYEGKKFPQDYTMAAQFFAQAVKAGVTKAWHPLGLSLYHGGSSLGDVKLDMQRALIALNTAGENGDLSAYKSAAMIYQNGEGVESTPEIIAEYLRRSGSKYLAEQYLIAHAHDSHLMSTVQVTSNGSNQQIPDTAGASREEDITGQGEALAESQSSENEAKNALNAEPEQEFTQVNSDENTSRRQEAGQNLEQEQEQRQEREHGMEESCARILVPVDEEQLRNYPPKEREAIQGNFSSALNFGRQYYYERNYDYARRFIQVASCTNNPEARMLLARLYLYGLGGLNKRTDLAIQNYTRAAEQSYLPAQTELCYHYATGSFGERDSVKAAAFCEQGAKQGGARAALYLSRAYRQGHGKVQNPTMSYAWLRVASACLDEARNELHEFESSLPAAVRVNGASELSKLKRNIAGCKVEEHLELSKEVLNIGYEKN